MILNTEKSISCLPIHPPPPPSVKTGSWVLATDGRLIRPSANPSLGVSWSAAETSRNSGRKRTNAFRYQNGQTNTRPICIFHNFQSARALCTYSTGLLSPSSDIDLYTGVCIFVYTSICVRIINLLMFRCLQEEGSRITFCLAVLSQLFFSLPYYPPLSLFLRLSRTPSFSPIRSFLRCRFAGDQTEYGDDLTSVLRPYVSEWVSEWVWCKANWSLNFRMSCFRIRDVFSPHFLYSFAFSILFWVFFCLFSLVFSFSRMPSGLLLCKVNRACSNFVQTYMGIFFCLSK